MLTPTRHPSPGGTQLPTSRCVLWRLQRRGHRLCGAASRGSCDTDPPPPRKSSGPGSRFGKPQTEPSSWQKLEPLLPQAPPFHLTSLPTVSEPHSPDHPWGHSSLCPDGPPGHEHQAPLYHRLALQKPLFPLVMVSPQPCPCPWEQSPATVHPPKLTSKGTPAIEKRHSSKRT